MNQNSLFQGAVTIPAIASIEVRDVGIIAFATMKFSDRVTLISSPHALGTTTLVQSIAVAGGCSVPATSLVSAPARPRNLGVGTWTLLQLEKAIHRTGADQCLVLDRDVFLCLELPVLAQAFRLMESSSCQIIAFLSAVVLSGLPTRLRKSVRYELVEDPAHEDRARVSFSAARRDGSPDLQLPSDLKMVLDG